MKRRKRMHAKNVGLKKEKKNRLLAYRIKLILSCSFIFIFVSLMGIILSASFFFRVEAIEVSGVSKYNSDDIIAQSGVKVGDSVFLINGSKVQSELEKAFPYIEAVRLIKKFPNKVIISMKTSEKSRVFKSESKYIEVNSYGKILEILDEYKGDTLLIEGLECDNLEIGAKLSFKGENTEERIENIIGTMKNNGLQNITYINFKSLANVLVEYDHRIKIKLGLYDSIDYKIRTASEIILKNIGDLEKGELDLSLLTKDGKSYFTPL